MNLGLLLKQKAESEKDRVFFYFEDQRRTFGDLFARVSSLAAGLVKQGLKPGDKVGIYLSNCPEYIEALLAVIYAGGVVMPVNPAWRSNELGDALENSSAKFLVFSQKQAAQVEKLENQKLALEKSFIIGEESHLDWINFKNLFLEKAAEPFDAPENSLALLTYTSGTTGVPKAVMLTHKNLISNFKATAEFLGLRDNDKVLGVLPFYHVMGIAFALAPLFSPASVVLLSEFIPKTAMAALMSHKITAFFSAPMAYTLLGSLPNHPVGPVSGLRFAVSGGAPLRREIHERFEQKFHIELLEGYGLSEATCVIAMNPPAGKRKIGSVGVPLPGVNIKVMSESGEQLKADEIGELWVSGDSIMAGYLGDRAETRTAVRDGWLHTGDLGYCDADGYYFIEGRKKDLIIRGGENIYPREIEEILVRHPGVMEAAVIGIPDWVWGEEVMAFVVPRANAELTASALAEYCHHQMADYKSPRIWRILSEMPRSAAGEVLKKKLFEIYQTGQD